MARYKNSVVSKDKNGKRYFRSEFDTLAQNYYGDSNLWWIIAKANNINDGSIGLDPEKRIRIPIEIQPILDSV